MIDFCAACGHPIRPPEGYFPDPVVLMHGDCGEKAAPVIAAQQLRLARLLIGLAS